MNDEPTNVPRTAADATDTYDGAWADLRRLTAARIGLSRAGASLATTPMLDIRLAHARARDAVHTPLDQSRLVADLAALGHPIIEVMSQASDRPTYLMRPDLGRALAPESTFLLRQQSAGCDIVFVVADGLSARAVQAHAQPVLARVLSALPESLRVGPIVIARHGRVAIGDAIAEILHATCVAMLIGERPGLSAPDSMGAYLTWQPHTGTTDAERNCISNIRPDGIGYDDAAFKVTRLLLAMRARRISGVALKDDTERLTNE
jgi:ethanolamine ammonia-lyase small subunit